MVGGAGVFTSARIWRSWRLGGLLYATSGGSGTVFLSRSEMCKIGRCFLISLFRLLSPGRYMCVTTKGICFSVDLLGWGCKDSAGDTRLACWICSSTMDSLYLRAIRCFFSSSVLLTKSACLEHIL